jgi:tryptophan synthase alpha chain
MTALASRLQALRARGEKALIPFVTAGDPALEDLPAILGALAEAGADAIEVGVPFSDPIADGPAIQASSQRALERGTTPPGVLGALRGWSGGVPLVLMGYLNPVLRMGMGAFAEAAREAGVSGTILCDLIPEEADGWIAACRASGLDTIFLASPLSSGARLEAIARASSGFVYALTRTGVTGPAGGDGSGAAGLVRRLREVTSLPVCAGFGIGRPEQVRAACEVADGAIVGSWLVDLLARTWDGGAGRAGIVAAVAGMKAATRV